MNTRERINFLYASKKADEEEIKQLQEKCPHDKGVNVWLYSSDWKYDHPGRYYNFCKECDAKLETLDLESEFGKKFMDAWYARNDEFKELPFYSDMHEGFNCIFKGQKKDGWPVIKWFSHAKNEFGPELTEEEKVFLKANTPVDKRNGHVRPGFDLVSWKDYFPGSLKLVPPEMTVSETIVNK